MNIEDFKKRLRNYKRKEIIFLPHAEIQALMRNIDLEEIKNNILNPDKLVHIEEQESLRQGEDKYGCYFGYSDFHCHKYVLTLNRKIIIVTIININRNWQRIIEGKRK